MQASTVILFLFISLISSACRSPEPKPAPTEAKKTNPSNSTSLKNLKKENNLERQLKREERRAHRSGRSILRTARQMSLINKEILPGGCWDYIDTVYDRAGFKRHQRQTVFKSKKRGPFASQNKIKAGDWLYFINHGYRNVEHSAIFIAWLDYKQKKAMMLSYAGERRKVPARYKEYDLRSVYQIIRPKEK
ncbi:MAG: NlpC/P60 family protein [Gammaproteobacteria bacterium]|nr:NlpC/P60 family protein [Gammaproteobacteria bacterium]